jgi:hypothetical protein
MQLKAYTWLMLHLILIDTIPYVRPLVKSLATVPGLDMYADFPSGRIDEDDAEEPQAEIHPEGSL